MENIYRRHRRALENILLRNSGAQSGINLLRHYEKQLANLQRLKNFLDNARSPLHNRVSEHINIIRNQIRNAKKMIQNNIDEKYSAILNNYIPRILRLTVGTKEHTNLMYEYTKNLVRHFENSFEKYPFLKENRVTVKIYNLAKIRHKQYSRLKKLHSFKARSRREISGR